MNAQNINCKSLATHLDKNKYEFKLISNKFEINGKMLSYIYTNGYCKFYHDFDNYWDHKREIQPMQVSPLYVDQVSFHLLILRMN